MARKEVLQRLDDVGAHDEAAARVTAIRAAADTATDSAARYNVFTVASIYAATVTDTATEDTRARAISAAFYGATTAVATDDATRDA